MLGHADGSVTAIYNRYEYVKEMRPVLGRWAAGPTDDELNVTTLRAKTPEISRATYTASLPAEEAA